MTRYYAIAVLCLFPIVAAGCSAASAATSPTSALSQYPATWITASWVGGASSPTDLQTKQTPQSPLSPLCPPNALVFHNYNYAQLLSLSMLGDCPLNTTNCNNLVIQNACTVPITVSLCLSSGSGGFVPVGARLKAACAQDPLQTSAQNLMTVTLPASSSRNAISQVSPDLAINVFFCGGLDIVDGPPLKCHKL